MDHLPVEIVLQIFASLPAADLIRVSWVSRRFWELAGDRHLLRHLDFSQAYTCSQEDLKAFFRSSKRCCSVHKLNLDTVYWFRPPLATIARMKNLESLHMRGISLTFRQLHGLLTAGLLLQELTLDWPRCHLQPAGMIEEMQEGVSRLKFLCLTCQTMQNVITFLKQCPGSLRLVLFCEKWRHFSPFRCRLDLFFAHRPTSVFPMESSEWRTMWKYLIKLQDEYSASVSPAPFDQVTEMVCTNLDTTFKPQPIPGLKGLQILDTPGHLVDLCGVTEAAPSLERLRLDIHHFEKNRKYFHSISSLHHLTHLSLPTYVLCETSVTKETHMTPTTPGEVFSQSFKRRRLGISSSMEDPEVGALNLIIDSCPLLIMLEIGLEENFKPARSQLEALVYWQSLKNIRKLKKLTHLTLCNIPVTNGHFLYEIAVGCQQLVFLRLSNLGPSGKCCYLKDLANSVVHMDRLTHLRVHQPYLAPGANLFTALKKCQRLQRLSITSKRDMLPLDLSVLEQLVKARPSLIFVAVEGAGTSKVACKKFARNVKNISRPALVVFISIEEGSPHIPLAHRDMIHDESWLSGSFSSSCYNPNFPFRHHVLHITGTQVQD